MPHPRRHARVCWSIWLTVGFVLGGGDVHAQDDPPAGRPWFVVSVSNLDQLQATLDNALAAADRPELAEILAGRIKRWGDLAGVDRTRPLGLVRFWPVRVGAQSEEVLFVPSLDRDQFLKTVTFDVVPFAQRTPDHYVIERPGSPYHVVFRHDVGWLGDRTATLHACAGQAGDWTSELVKRHDVGVLWDLRQVPVETRRTAAAAWREQLVPLLQRRDNESAEAFEWRQAWSAPLVSATGLAIEQTQRIVLRVIFDADRSSAVVDVRLIPEPKSEWASTLKRWRPARSPWRELAHQKDARSGGFITGVPSLGSSSPDAAGGQVAWQVFGDLLPLRTAVLAISEGPIQEKPRDLSTKPAAASEFERVRVPEVPTWVRTWIGGNTEAWRVTQKEATWYAFGPPELARARLDAALAPPSGPPPLRTSVCLFARLPLRECLAGVPWLDALWTEEQLRGVEDRVELSVAPLEEGLQVRAVLPIGALRLLGGLLADDLHQEAQFLLFPPDENE